MMLLGATGPECRVRGLTVALVAAAAACTATEDPAGTTGTETSGSTTSSAGGDTSSSSESSSSGGDTSSSGEPLPPPPDPCATAEIAQGIVGRTDLRTCDTEGDCVAPEPGVEVSVFDESPQIGGGPSEPGMLDPAVPMLDSTTSDADGLFAFELPASSYYVCTAESSDTVLCSERIIIVGADPLHAAVYETGNGSSWTTSACE